MNEEEKNIDEVYIKDFHMRACTHNVLLVNQISCSRGERTIRVYWFTFISNSLMRCASAWMSVCVCMHEPT
jgi:hypothetical protein